VPFQATVAAFKAMVRGSTVMRTFVLVPCGWAGGWAWRDVIERLRAPGHQASAVTLTGLGERAHLLGDEIGLSTHVEDVVAHIEMEDLASVDLVGWSYSGMVVTGVLARLPDRIASVSWLDAFVPSDGQSLADLSLGRAPVQARECAAARRPYPVRDLEYFGVSDPAVLAFCRPRLRPQPWRAMVEPVHALPEIPEHVSLRYVRCTGWQEPGHFRATYERLRRDPRWVTRELAADHFAPLTDPDGTVRAPTD
jgi:pimeloyl-ACP methyl ester carboxylesterase